MDNQITWSIVPPLFVQNSEFHFLPEVTIMRSGPPASLLFYCQPNDGQPYQLEFGQVNQNVLDPTKKITFTLKNWAWVKWLCDKIHVKQCSGTKFMAIILVHNAHETNRQCAKNAVFVVAIEFDLLTFKSSAEIIIPLTEITWRGDHSIELFPDETDSTRFHVLHYWKEPPPSSMATTYRCRIITISVIGTQVGREIRNESFSHCSQLKLQFASCFDSTLYFLTNDFKKLLSDALAISGDYRLQTLQNCTAGALPSNANVLHCSVISKTPHMTALCYFFNNEEPRKATISQLDFYSLQWTELFGADLPILQKSSFRKTSDGKLYLNGCDDNDRYVAISAPKLQAQPGDAQIVKSLEDLRMRTELLFENYFSPPGASAGALQCFRPSGHKYKQEEHEPPIQTVGESDADFTLRIEDWERDVELKPPSSSSIASIKYSGSLEFKKDLKGRTAEKQFFKWFHKLGSGMLLHSFNLKHFYAWVKCYSKINGLKDWEDKKLAEIDYLFIHEDYGVHIIEVKGNGDHSPGLSDAVNKVVKQIKRSRKIFKDLPNGAGKGLFSRLLNIGSNDEIVNNIFGAHACFPNVFKNELAIENLLHSHSINFVGGDVIGSDVHSYWDGLPVSEDLKIDQEIRKWIRNFGIILALYWPATAIKWMHPLPLHLSWIDRKFIEFIQFNSGKFSCCDTNEVAFVLKTARPFHIIAGAKKTCLLLQKLLIYNKLKIANKRNIFIQLPNNASGEEFRKFALLVFRNGTQLVLEGGGYHCVFVSANDDADMDIQNKALTTSLDVANDVQIFVDDMDMRFPANEDYLLKAFMSKRQDLSVTEGNALNSRTVVALSNNRPAWLGPGAMGSPTQQHVKRVIKRFQTRLPV